MNIQAEIRKRKARTLAKPVRDFVEEAKKRLMARRIILVSGCWLWTGDTSQRGYGRTSYKGDRWSVHRLSLFLFKPLEYKETENVCHKCDTPKCFNPEHLFSASQSVNMLDCVKKGRHPEVQRTHCPKGHEYTPENTLLEKGNKRKCRICAKNNRIVSHLLSGK